MCQHLHVLPQKGALLDQDSFMVWAMDLVVEAQQAKEEMDRPANVRRGARGR